MQRARIRWRNVARLAAGVGGVALAVAFLPSMLERPQPPPLPPDVGLATAAADPGAQAPQPQPKPKPATRRPGPHRGGQAHERRPQTRTGQPSRPDREAAGAREIVRRRPAALAPAPQPTTAPPPSPAPPREPTPPAASSPPVPEAPPPEPAQPAPETAASVSRGSAHVDPPRGPNEFGFEQ